MGSIDRNGGPVLGWNTFQRMLEAEKRNKANYMQASPIMPLVRTTSTVRAQNAISTLEYIPETLSAKARAMTSPALSITIPPPTSNDVSKKYIVRPGGEVVPHEDGTSDQETDASSICHSPGWDDLSGRKRKKEKREAKERKRREKGKTEPANKQETRTKHRLSKPPPNSNSRFVNRIPNGDRSTSESSLPTLQNGVESSSKPKPSEEGRRSRRGSFDLGIKTLKNAVIPNAWRSSSASRTPAVTPTVVPADPAPNHEKPPSRGSFSYQMSRSSTDNNGFIGGLKLRQAEEAEIQETIRQVQTVKTNDIDSQPVSERDLALKTEETSSSVSLVDSIRPTSIYEESVRSPDHWDQIFASAAKMTSNTPSIQDLEPEVPIMERNIKKGRRSHPPTSRYFPLDTDVSMNTTRDPSVASTRTSINSSPYAKDEQNGNRLSQFSIPSPKWPDLPTQRQFSARPDSIELSRGRQNTSNVQNHRQQNHDQSMTGARNEPEGHGSNSKESRGRRLSFGRSKNSYGAESRETTMKAVTKDISKGHETDQEMDVMESIRVEALIAPQTHQGQPLATRTEGKAGNVHRKSSSRTSLKGFRAAAKNAFSRTSIIVDSPSSSSTGSPKDSIPISRPQLTTRAVTTDSILHPVSTVNKAERILGEVVSQPSIKDFGQRPYSSGHPLDSPDSLQHPNTNGALFNGVNSRSFHVRTATDSSEEYSTLDEFSNVTTPTASRPSSQKNYKSVPNEPSPEMPQSELPPNDSYKKEFLDSPPLMSGAVPFGDAGSTRDSWCRTAKEFQIPEDEDRLKTPTGRKQSVTNFSTPFREPSPPKTAAIPHKTSLELNQKPSMPHSISTPNIHDLSFLPTLKHQALGRPEKELEKGKAKETDDFTIPVENKGKHSSSKGKEPVAEQKSLIRPSIKPITTMDTKSETDLSKDPSQYLQNARLNMFRPKPHSPTSSFPPNPNFSHSQGGPETIAKMFVVCCSCKYFHDMPSKIYECMANPDNVVTDTNLGVSGVISTSVKCPWCGHGMTTSCCAGYAAVVHLRERFH